MEHYGKITRIDGDMALIQLSQSSRCADCKACEMFNTNEPVEIRAHNPFNAQTGDQVKVEIAPTQVVGHSLFVFLFPILALLIGYGFGVKFASISTIGEENSGIIGSIVFLCFSFIPLYFYDRLFARKKSNRGEITAITD